LITLMLGDCLERMKEIESGSVDMILTDLPYGTIKGMGGDLAKYKHLSNSSWDNVINTEEVMSAANRLLRKNGKMVLSAQQPFTTELISKAIPNLPHCYNMYWDKLHFANCLIANKAPVSYIEDILVFSKNDDYEGLHPLRHYFKKAYDFIGLTKKRIIATVGQRADHVLRFNSSQFDLCTLDTYNSIIYNYRIDTMHGYTCFNELQQIDHKFKAEFSSTFNLWEGNKYKSNILKYKKYYSGHHPTQKPVLLLEDLIKTFSNQGDTILDMTMGSGSTGVAAKNLDRKFIGIELDENYFNIAKERIIEA